MKNLITLIVLFLMTNTIFAQEFCPGNLFTNGDLEIGTPTAGDQDINNADGFSSIWATGSLADFYAYNAGPFLPPLPAEGNYAGLWISNNPSSSTTYREGLYNELNTPLTSGSGTYSFTFDVACLYGWGTAELGIYGIYNPTNAYSATPTSSHSPSNENLFGPANTVLLGTVFLGDSCDRYKTTQTITFDSGAGSFPVGGMTHVLLTPSSDSISGAVYVGLDNFCMQLETPAEDTCALVVKETFDCDANGTTYTFWVQNNTGQIVDGIIVNGDYDPGVIIPVDGNYGPVTIDIPVSADSVFCFDLILFSENLACCHTTHCVELPTCDPCESIDLVARSNDQEGACCYEVDVINNFDPAYFTSIVSTIITPGVNFDTPTGDNGWTSTALAGNVLSWTPSGAFIDEIADPGVLNFCFKDIDHMSQTPQVVVFDWIAGDTATGENIVCSDTLTFYCEPCMTIQNDDITCLADGSYDYCFTISNNSDFDATELYFDPYTPAGIVFSPNPMSISLAAHSSNSYCVNLSGGSAGDLVAYKAILKNFSGTVLNWCCIVDTFTVSLPECQNELPCPIIEDYMVECTDDVDGDGLADYIMDLYIDGAGTINLSSPCGTVSPASLTVAASGTYTFTVSNSSGCDPFALTYYSFAAGSSTICAEDQLQISLPECQINTSCVCDEAFYDAVNLGFSDNFNCPNGDFRPYALEDCDRITWTVNGVSVGSTIGNQIFSYEYPGIGTYEVCMLVTRIQADGNICEHQFCTEILIEQWCNAGGAVIGFNKVEVFPNPIRTTVQVKWEAANAPETLNLQVVNTKGKEMIQLRNVDAKSGSTEVDFSRLDAGFYLLRLSGENFAPAPVKLVKISD